MIVVTFKNNEDDASMKSNTIPANSCHVAQAEDGEVAIFLESAQLNETTQAEVSLNSGRLTITQQGALFLDVAGLSDWAMHAIQQAPRLLVIAVADLGMRSEVFAVNENVARQA